MTADLKRELSDCRKAAFPVQQGQSATEAVRAFALDIDRILTRLFMRNAERHPAFARTCIVGLGGYGRGEMCPYSDIDVLVLYDDATPKPAIESFTRDLWDLGAAMGCVVRTLEETSSILGDDPATDNAHLDCAHIVGNVRLYEKLVDEVVVPFFRRRRRSIIDDFRQELHKRVYSSVNTLFRVEPDLKNGICALRDCQRLIWGERVNRLVIGGRQHPPFQLLGAEAAATVLKAYDFLLSLRLEMHVLAGRRLDLLEIGMQPQVAASLGIGQDNPGLLMERYFRAVTEVRHAVHVFLEKAPKVVSMWDWLRQNLSFYTVPPGLAVVDGTLYMRRGRPSSDWSPVLWMLATFRSAITCHAVLSMALRNTIRRMVRDVSPTDFRTKAVDEQFRLILSRHRPVGRVLQLMHETTFLEGIIPEFGKLTCRVEYDTYHEYTVDEHTLLALCALDDLGHDKDPLVRRLYLSLPRLPLLRLGLLLHDIGKALPGDHSRTGAVIAENVARRLGFDKDETERVRFLVYSHLALSELSLQREPEPELIQAFAERVRDQENLDMLFLLTVLDIRHVGSRSWTGWKAAQLKDIYRRTSGALNDELYQHSGEAKISAGFGEDMYLRNTLPEEREDHRRWLEEAQEHAVRLHCESFVGFDRLTVIALDRKGFLSDFLGCLYAEGLHVIHAVIHSTDDGRVLDVFSLECDDVTSVPFRDRVEGVRRRWDALLAGRGQVETMVHERMLRYPVKAQRKAPRETRVALDNEISPRYSVLEVDAPDSVGLLHRVATVLAAMDIIIVAARVSTLIDQVRDVFYVTDSAGQKILAEETCRRVRSRVAALFDAAGD